VCTRVFKDLLTPLYIGGVGLARRITKTAGKSRGMPEGKGVEPAAEPHCGHQAVARLGGFSFGASHGLPCVTGRHSARPAGRSQKKIKSTAALWHLSQRNPQAGGAAVVLTASALPGLAHALQAGLLSHSLRAWNATATGFPGANGGHPTGRAALRSRQKINQVSYSAISSL
jgi:hypothetical protein